MDLRTIVLYRRDLSSFPGVIRAKEWLNPKRMAAAGGFHPLRIFRQVGIQSKAQVIRVLSCSVTEAGLWKTSEESILECAFPCEMVRPTLADSRRRMTTKKKPSPPSPRRKAVPRARPQKSGKPHKPAPPPAGTLWDDNRAFPILVKNSTEIFTFLDAGGKILYRSPSIGRVIHSPDRDVLQSNFLSLIWPEDRDEAKQTFEQIIKSPGKTVPFQIRSRGDGENPRWVEGYCTNHLKNPAIGALLLNYHDITDRKQQEIALRENERRYRELFENAMLAIFQSTFDGKVIRVNPAFARLFGYDSPEDVAASVGNIAADFYADPKRRAEIIRQHAENPDQSTFENLFRRRDGSTFWGLLNVRTVTDDAGRPLHLEGFIEDIDDRKRAEEALRESAETFRSIFDNSSAGVALVGFDRRIRMVNPAFCEIFGYTEEELLNPDFLDLTHPDDVEHSRQILQDVLSGKGRSSRFSKRYIHKDGHTIYAEVSAALVFGDDGKPSHFIAHILDVTERRRAEEALRESEAHYRALVETSPIAIAITDLTGNMRMCNLQTARLLGYERPEDLFGKSAFEMFPPDERDRAGENLLKTLTEGSTRNTEYRLVKKDGTLFPAELSAAVLLDDKGNPAEFMALIYDISQRRRADEALRESEEKYRLLSELSPDSISLYQEGRITFANPATARLMGADSPEQLIGKPMLDFVHPDYRQLVIDRSRQQEQDGLAVPVAEERFIRLDGSVIDVDVVAAPVLYQGKKAHLVISRDISERKLAVEKLHALASRHEALLAAIPEIVMEVDCDKIYRWANPAGIEFFGEGVIGRAAAAYFEGEQTVYATVQPLFNGKGETIYVESWQRRKDGQKRLLGWWCRNLKNGRGEVTGALSSARDITEQHQAEEQIQSLSRFPTENPNPVMRISPEGVLLFANNASRAFLDMWKAGVGEAVPEECRALIGEVYRTNSVRETEMPIGEAVFICTLTPIQPAGYVNVYGRNITERKQAEEQLRESEEKYRTLIELSPDPIFIHTEGVVSYVNSAGLALLGAEHPGQILGKQVLDLIHPDYRELVAKRYQEAVRENKQLPLSEEKYLRLDGTYVDVEARGKPLFMQGKTCAQVVMRDITERKLAQDRLARQAEELRQRNAELARLNELTERRMQRLIAMRAIDTAITSSFKLELVLSILLGQLTDLLGIHAADILIFLPDLQTFHFAGGRGFRNPIPDQIFIRKAASYANQAAQERRTVKLPRLEERTDIAKIYPKIAGEDFAAYECIPLMAKGLVKGVLEIFHRGARNLSPEEETFLEMVAGQAAIAIDNAEMFEGLQSSNDELTLAYADTLTGWARTLELRNRETAGEAQRLAEIAIRLGRSLGANENELQLMYRGAILHDIGMMGIPDSILLKAGPLTEEERAIVHKHPQFANDLLSSINYLRPAIDIPFSHHERWNGSGYPRGLKGDQIPLAARVFAVVDVWDALRSRRPYREPWTEADAREYIRQNSGILFDPNAAQIFLEIISGG
jgi:PAS domain S-box-containing protein